MSGQIVPLFPGSRQVVRPDEEQRVAELEANVAIARAAALRAWMAARGVTLFDNHRAEELAFAAWWDGTP